MTALRTQGARVVTLVFVAAAVGAAAAACTALLDVPPTATIACASNADCPADRACIDERCLAASLDCVVDVNGALGAAVDGTDCAERPNGVCVRGECFTRGCGDGFFDSATEECDFGVDNSDTAPDRCRSDCTAARCGDGVIDRGETCDEAGAECVGCAQLCAIGKADCDGAVGCECAPTAVFDTHGNFVEALVLGDDAIYALGGTPATDQQIGLLKIARDGSSSTVLKAPIDSFGTLSLDDTHVYFADGPNLVRVPRSGGDEEIVAPEFLFSLDGDSITVFDEAAGVARIDKQTLARTVLFGDRIDALGSGVAVRGQVFVATALGDVLALDGGALRVVTSHQLDEGGSVELVSDGRDVYWLDDRTELWRLPLSDTGPSGDATIVATGPAMQRGARTYHLHVDDAGAVYAAELVTDANTGKGGIMDVVPGGAPRMRARHTHQENAVDADATSICFSDDFSVIYCVPR